MRAQSAGGVNRKKEFCPKSGRRELSQADSQAMTTFVALLRAVNVGGTGKLPMTELKAMCEKLGFTNVQTYIASGNVVFESRKSEASVKAALKTALQKTAAKPVGVLVRTPAELAKVAEGNPFPNEPTKWT